LVKRKEWIAIKISDGRERRHNMRGLLKGSAAFDCEA
jgi:hypothetical protein